MERTPLHDKVIVITGAAGGQGAAHSEYLAGLGAKVVLADVLDDRGESLAADLRARGMEAMYHHLDVTDAAQWRMLIGATAASFGPVTTLVNNAGISSRAGVENISPDEWQRVVAVNQTGIVLGIQAVVPGMRERGAGSVVNISSLWAHTGGQGKGNVGYVATKSAVLGITRNAAMDLAGLNIRVNSISPGYIDHLMAGKPDGTVAEVLTRIPLGRLAYPAEVSPSVAFFASDESSYITGVDLLIDGGLHLGS